MIYTPLTHGIQDALEETLRVPIRDSCPWFLGGLLGEQMDEIGWEFGVML